MWSDSPKKALARQLATRSKKTERSGQADQAEDNVQQGVGKAKDALCSK